MLGRRELNELRERVARLEAEKARARWYTIAGGVASVLGASLALFTLLTLLDKLSELQ